MASKIPVHLFNLSRKVIMSKSFCSTLIEVGKLELSKTGPYNTGQLVVHKILGYRGIILFPWLTKVYDWSVLQQEGEKSKEIVVSRTQTFYQVLIDERDCPFVKAQTEPISFVTSDEPASQNLQIIPGLDYVAHDEVIPYTSTEPIPVKHNLFNQFLAYNAANDPPYVAKDKLLIWKNKHYPCLQLSDVHRQITENIRVTVIPFYVGRRQAKENYVYLWRYCVRLENLSTDSVQLRERCWKIFTSNDVMETVRGQGVIGQEPLLCTVVPIFQYSSHVSLEVASGHMWGTFKMEREDGSFFDCRIPSFPLESPFETSDGSSIE